MDDEQWQQLIRAFGGVKDFRVAGELVTDILRALCSAGEGGKSVLPALRNLHAYQPTSGPSRDSLQSFLTLRNLSDHPVQVYPLASNTIFSQSPRFDTVPIRRPTTEEVMPAKRWVEEQKRTTFSHRLEGVAGSLVLESETQEYTRNLNRLDMVLGNIEKYIHIAFAALRKEDVVRRLFAMMASTKFQLEESKKSNPLYVLELHTIRGMIQEADNMDKGLRTVLGFKLEAQGNAPAPPQPPSMGPTPLFTQTALPAAPPVFVGEFLPPPITSFRPGTRKKQPRLPTPGAAMSTQPPPPASTVSTLTPQAATPNITAPSPQTSDSPKGNVVAKPTAAASPKVQTKVNSLGVASTAPAIVSTPTSSTLVDMGGGVKRVREDEDDGARPEVASAPSLKRVKFDWEGPHNEEAPTRDEHAGNA